MSISPKSDRVQFYPLFAFQSIIGWLFAGLFILCMRLDAQTADFAFNSAKIQKNLFGSNSGAEKTQESREQTNTERACIPRYSRSDFHGFAFKNYSFKYEKTVSKKIAAVISFRYMPSAALPFANNNCKTFSYGAGNNNDYIDNLRLSNIAFTPELRIYLNRQPGRSGFYIAPFYRYAGFSNKNFIVDFTNDVGHVKSIRLWGNLTSTTTGVLIGAQWRLPKKFFFNWWLLGPHYNSSNGLFSGNCSFLLSSNEQDELRKQLYNIHTPFAESKTRVGAQNTSFQLARLDGGLRGGLSIGVRF